jgi:MFS family permease
MAGGTVAVEHAALGRWRGAVTAAFGLGGITIAAWGPRLPAIKSDLGIGTGAIGLLLAGVTIGSIVGLVASTPIIHWFGNRHSLTGALLVIAAALAIIGVAISLRSVPLLSVAFVVIGAGIGTLDVLINVEGAAIEEAAARTLMPLTGPRSLAHML